MDGGLPASWKPEIPSILHNHVTYQCQVEITRGERGETKWHKIAGPTSSRPLPARMNHTVAARCGPLSCCSCSCRLRSGQAISGQGQPKRRRFRTQKHPRPRKAHSESGSDLRSVSKARCGSNARTGSNAHLFCRHQRTQLFEGGFADALDFSQILHALEGAIGGAVFDDPLGADFANAR